MKECETVRDVSRKCILDLYTSFIALYKSTVSTGSVDIELCSPVEWLAKR